MAGCAGGVTPPGAEPRPSVRFARPLQVYREIGLITGPDDFPVVASVATVAGRADSTLLLLGLSMPTDA
ncbi:MAG: hypothetical protein GWN02_09865, partial [Gemmatimonadetes bacterium]|nr:hypothetical protein [Gemmatimonadota bacterium]